MADQLRPPKLIIPNAEKDYQPKPTPGGGPKPMEVTGDYKGRLLGQLDALEHAFAATLNNANAVPAVACVRMKKTVMAKTHRPWELFTGKTCPIIGARDLGDILVSVDKSGLQRLRDEIRDPTKINNAAMTKIDSIDPFFASAYMGTTLRELQHAAEDGGVELRLRLFDHRNEVLNRKVMQSFRALAGTADSLSHLDYVAGVPLFKLLVTKSEGVVALANFVGTRSLDEMPGYSVDSQEFDVGPMTDELIGAPVKGVEYPVIGLLDSGTDPNNKRLQAWVVGRDEADIPRADQDNRHGTFIAGLLVNARGFNHDDPKFPAGSCKVFDAVVIPQRVTGARPHPEDDLIQSIRRIIREHHKSIKVWNLSISSIKAVCADDCFSPFAMALDEIQDEYDVVIVTCTGNLAQHGVCGWPREAKTIGERDRMFPGADSVRAISVASLAHRKGHDSIAKENEPSPFSRRGPGPSFQPKPELSHYGGNCNQSGGFSQCGILSLGLNGVVERIGTSYSSPLVAKVLGQLRHDVTRPISRNLSKALLVQAAMLRSSELSVNDLRYKGFGVPEAVEDLFNCPPWAATLIFEPSIDPRRNMFHMGAFPIPKCFRRGDGTVEGEFLMTLAYDPPLDAEEGPEYCRTNLDVSLGTYDKGKDGKLHHSKKIPQEPADASKLYEAHQLEHGYKWSPLKVYRTKLSGTGGTHWRLKVELLTRTPEKAKVPQTAALVVTLYDRSKPTVYDDVVRELGRNGWVSQDLRIRDRLRFDGGQ